MLGRHDEALEQWLQALKIHPSWPRLYANISAHLERLGRLDEAAAWSVRARELTRDPRVGMNLVRIFFEFGDYDRARTVIDAVPPGHPLYGSARASAQMIQLDFTTALAIMESHYGEQRNVADFVFDKMSDIALLAGDLDTALEYCLRQDPSLATDDHPRIDHLNTHNAVKLAYILQRNGEHNRAEQLLAATLPVVRRNPRLGIVGEGIGV